MMYERLCCRFVSVCRCKDTRHLSLVQIDYVDRVICRIYRVALKNVGKSFVEYEIIVYFCSVK